MGSMQRKILLGWGLTLAIVIFIPIYWLNEPRRMAVAGAEFRMEAVERGEELYADHCASCHGDEGEGIPNVGSVLNSKGFLEMRDDEALRAATHDGLPNTMMPAYAQAKGGPLRDNQIEDLVAFMRDWEETASLLPEATPAIEAAALYAQYCAGCHGPNGEGTEDVSLAMNSRGFLERTNDALLFKLTAQGRPEQGMPAFEGELSNAEINALVAFMRAWEATVPEVQMGGDTLYARYCAFCHGANGEGTAKVPGALNSAEFLSAHDDDDLRRAIAHGHENMLPWSEEQGGIMTAGQIDELVALVRAWVGEPSETVPKTESTPSFASDILPLFEEHCAVCHSATTSLGGWDGSSYKGAIESGDNAPTIIPGDPEGSLLVQKMMNTQKVGKQMPIAELLPREQVQVVIDWVKAGAEDN